MHMRRALVVKGNSSRIIFLDELLTLNCPSLMNSSLLEVMETFTEEEPE